MFTTIICHGLVCNTATAVHGAARKTRSSAFPISARATPSLQGSLRGRETILFATLIFSIPRSQVSRHEYGTS